MSEFTIEPGIEAKGRNGYFKVASVKVYVPRKDQEGLCSSNPLESNVEIRSKISGKTSPIRIVGETESLIKMLQKTINELKKDQRRGGTYA